MSTAYSMTNFKPESHEKLLPLILSPDGEHSLGALVGRLKSEKESVEQALVAHGAVLLRGYPIVTPDDFEHVVTAIDDQLQTRYLGTSPRQGLAPHVFTASELPGYYPIPQHCEMSFLNNPPKRLYFGCLVAPKRGGETPLVDFRKVYRDMNPDVLARFEQGGIRIIRNYCGPKTGRGFDLWKLKRWDEIFGTSERDLVEAECERQGIEFEWYGEDRLRLISGQPATARHPETNTPAWFNHVQVFHMGSAPAEYKRIYELRGGFKMASLWRFTQLVVAMRRRFGNALDLPMHCTYMDGTEIRNDDLEHVRDLIWRHMVAIPWQKGDVLAIDNRSVSHGRLPYRGERLVVVSWA